MAFDDNFAAKLETECRIRRTHDFYLSDIPKEMLLIAKIHRSLPNCKSQPSFKLDWTKEQMQACALTFYKELDMDLYHTIKERACDVDNEIYISEPNDKWHISRVGFGKKHKRLMIEINPEDSVYGVLTFVHEFAHLLPIRAKKRVPQKLDYISEIESHFCELLMIDYLHENGILDDAERENELINYWKAFERDAAWLLQENCLIKKYKLSCPVTKESLNRIETESQNDPNHEFLMERLEIMANGRKGGRVEHGMHAYKYVFGRLVAKELYEDYQKDKKKTLRRFKKFLRKSNDYENSPKGRDDVLNDLLEGGKEGFLKSLNEKIK